MMDDSLEQDVRSVCNLVFTRIHSGARTIIGIAGPPASGKSTLAESVVQRLNSEAHDPVPKAALLPMDGYHIDNRLLESRGLLARKGAPETLNAAGFCEAVKSLCIAERETFHPKFDRQLDLAIANAIAIQPETPVVIVEGNYLLLRTEPWSSLRKIFAATVFVSPSIEVIHDRLQQRWINHGLDRETASVRVQSNDLPNAEFVVRESCEADLQLTQNYKEFGVRYAY